MSSDPHTPLSPSNLSIDQWDKVREENQLEFNNEKTSPEEGMPCERSYQKKRINDR
ncbi:hypothetical protein GRO01_00230 [Gluconobacter roseus NBRC 3990]|uniref:Uncharacterized protein n=1 Tax=Gluconobacter roseus NBRC 3990 TaxID=1307950 RepID=A0A4Y3M262_9PROT|nr:hypothetical protein AA3990_0583 [Gluconobacter roseus NBRC 3990]GEB02447.1 hypothetical protein GRO01_00230 [Gluconobacter roseus NBRC 3990]GLP92909.1 hypothetical protein GCM10007871_08870 [Gluconobacter roseus NBRC 3990]